MTDNQEKYHSKKSILGKQLLKVKSWEQNIQWNGRGFFAVCTIQWQQSLHESKMRSICTQVKFDMYQIYHISLTISVISRTTCSLSAISFCNGSSSICYWGCSNVTTPVIALLLRHYLGRWYVFTECQNFIMKTD